MSEFKCLCCYVKLTREEMGNHICPPVMYYAKIDGQGVVTYQEAFGSDCFPTKRLALDKLQANYEDGIRNDTNNIEATKSRIERYKSLLVKIEEERMRLT